MIRTFCDGCNKDTHTDKVLWGIHMKEIKEGKDNYVLHFCADCQKVVFKAVETVVKKLVTKHGES